MKTFKILLASSLLVGTSAMALTAKMKEPVVIKGTSVGEYRKPGAPVDIRYDTQHVEVGEVIDINIILTSSSTDGTMKVKVKVDKGLDEVSNVEKHVSFDLGKGGNEYPIALQVSADEDGLYYIKLHVSIKGQGMRAFAVPVYIGDAVLKTKKAVVEKTEKGENINVTEAQETITKE